MNALRLVVLFLIMTAFGCGGNRSTPSPSSSEPSTTTVTLNLTTTGWQAHAVQLGDGQGGWIDSAAESQLVTINSGSNWFIPFGVNQMDNGEILLLGVANGGSGSEYPIHSFSQDGGESWRSPWERVENSIVNPGGYAVASSGRPMLLTDLGIGRLTFSASSGLGATNFYTADYGGTWPEAVRYPPEGGSGEGNRLVHRDANGQAVKIAEIVWRSTGQYPLDPSIGMIRSSTDGGRTWSNGLEPREWQWQEYYTSRTYSRGTSEGSLVRAANGWIVAALRTDMAARFIPTVNDGLEGLGVSVSKDDGVTWSPVQILYQAGRHHGHLLLMPNGDIVLTYIFRHDIPDGATYEVTLNRGCEAAVSHDNGETWDLSRRYVLDHYLWTDGSTYPSGAGHLSSTVLSDGTILTAYGNYPNEGGTLIHWKLN